MSEEKKKMEDMTLPELMEVAEGIGMHSYSKLNKKELMNVLVLKKFISDPTNQSNAIMKAQQLKDMSKGTWFTPFEISRLTRPIEMVKGKRKAGKATHSEQDILDTITNLSLFGLMKRRVVAGKMTKYKVAMEAAAKAIADHREMLRATEIIEGKGGRIIIKK